MKPEEFYRPEAMESQRVTWTVELREGAIGWSHWFLGFAVLSAVTLVGLLFVDVTRRENVPGYITAAEGRIDLTAGERARVQRVLVVSGQRVTKGQVLAELDVERRFLIDPLRGSGNRALARLSVEALQRQRELVVEVTQARARLAQGNEEGLRQQEQFLLSRHSKLNDERTAIAGRLMLAEREVSRIAELVAAGFVNQAGASGKSDEVLVIKANLSRVESDVLDVERSIAATRAELDRARLISRIDDLEAAKASTILSRDIAEAQARQSIALTAPESGVVVGVFSTVGDSVGEGRVVISMVARSDDAASRGTEVAHEPNLPLVAHLLVSSRSVGLLSSGQRVSLKLSAFPFQKYGVIQGEIRSVGSMPIRSTDLPREYEAAFQGQSARNQTVYLVSVDIPEASGPGSTLLRRAKPGMLLEASIAVERRTLLDWVLLPMTSRLADAAL
jgi:membrane fusion protein